MLITAHLRNIRIAPRKVRLVSALIKGMDAFTARNQLYYLTKRAARPMAKVIDSAMANAQQNWGLLKENLFVKDVIVNEGAKLKRFRPKGFGSASPIEKKTSHITVVLSEKVPGLKAQASNDTQTHEHTHQTSETTITKQNRKTAVKESAGVKKTASAPKARIFQRKTG